MSKEKQIEEMAKHCFYNEGGNCCADLHKSVMCEDEAKTCALYQTLENIHIAGYRKQSEGEWRNLAKVGVYMCTACTQLSPRPYPYCPKCGAKMKGGAE